MLLDGDVPLRNKNVLNMPISATGLDWKHWCNKIRHARGRAGGLLRECIKMRSKEVDFNKAIKLLEKDLINGLYHCFGHHDNCSTDFCTTARDKMTLAAQSTPNDESDCTPDASSNTDLDEVQSE